MWYVYFLQHSENKDIYIGATNDLRNRLKIHNSGKNTSTKRISGKWILIYYESFKSKEDTFLREKRLKSHGRAKQEVFKRIKNSMI